MSVHNFDWLLVAVSVLGAGVVFGTKAPLEDGQGSIRGVRIVLVRLVATVAMIFPGALVMGLFGPDDAWTTYLKTAIALWLAPFILAVAHHLSAEPRESAAVDRSDRS